jgi:hypothetical protein
MVSGHVIIMQIILLEFVHKFSEIEISYGYSNLSISLTSALKSRL